ncbi:MAG: hypothetical protein R3314_11395 [Longimicrobiales bacterium]|nr:hypothetical protein [Longimicrobiales bacterium]
MESEHRTDTPPPIAPPAGRGITVEETDTGLRVTLPRLFGQSDVVTAVLAAAIAVWMGVWLDATARDPGASTLAWLAMAAVGVFFAALAVSEAVPILTRRVIEDRGDRIVLARRIGVRRVLKRTLRKPEITAVDWVWREDEPGVVEIRTDDAVHPIGKRLDVAGLEWLEGVIRQMLREPSDRPGPRAP